MSRRRELGAALLLACVTALAYLPALRGGFVWDDDSTLTANHLIKACDGLHRFWGTTEPVDYWPVTSTTLWVEWRFWGMHALGYHATNLALHIGEALILWAILRRLRIPGSYFAAFVFAVHPVNVESVAWIAQRKNLMAMLFFLLSILCFLKPGRPPSAAPGGGPEPILDRWYGLSLLAFTLGMLSKGSVAMLPAVLLGLTASRRRISTRDFLAMLPFFLVAGILVLVDVWFQHHGQGEAFRNAGPVERALGAGAAVWFYLAKTLLPVCLVFVYPQWKIEVDHPQVWMPLLAAIGLTAALWRNRKSGSRPALFAWAYFCVMLFPVLGFFDVYFMRYSLVADHYEHLAIIGIIALAGASAGTVFEKSPPSGRQVIRGVMAALVAALALLTYRQSRIYGNVETLYRTTLDRNPSCWMAYNNLGALLTTRGEFPEAIAMYGKSLELEPGYPEAHYDLGFALFKSGRMQDAAREYEAALKLRPGYADARYNLGMALFEMGRKEEAIAQYRQTLGLKPDYARAYNGLGLALAATGRLPEAIAKYDQALRLDPSDAGFHFNLGTALFQTGRSKEAMAEFEQAAHLRPGYAEAHNNWGVSLAGMNRIGEAVAEFEQAVRLDPSNPEFRRNLGSALQQAGRSEEAKAEFEAEARLQAHSIRPAP